MTPRVLQVELHRASAERQAEEAMLPVCCDDFEQAIAAGVVVGSRFAPGLVYLRTVGKHWAIQFCPHCAAPLALPGSSAPVSAAPLLAATAASPQSRRLRCGICNTKGHNVRTCPRMKGQP